MANWIPKLSLAAMVALGTASPVFAGETKDILEKECKKRLTELSSAACACIGEKAEADLSANVQKMVIVMLMQDRAAAGKVIGELTLEEMQKAAAFMASVPMACGKEG